MAEFIPTGVQPVQQGTDGSQGAKKEPPKSLSEAQPKELPKTDQYKSPLTDQLAQAQKMVRTTKDLGHKVDYRQTPRTMMEAPRQRQARPRPPVTHENYRKLSQERLFQQSNMRDTVLYRHMQNRSLPHGTRESSMLSRQHLSQLIRLRHQVEDRNNMRQLIRNEIQERREARQKVIQQSSSIKSEGGEGSGELFLNRQTFLLKNRTEGGEGGFEKLLKEMLRGAKVIPDVPQGMKGRFTPKGGESWKTFFANMLNLGTRETSITRNVNQLMEALFRGLYRQMANQKGMTLVSDLNFMTGDKVIVDKFARILVDHPELLILLEKMQPGDSFPADLLKQLGEELNYIQMTHQPEVATQTAREAARDAALAQLKLPGNQQAMQRMEQALKRDREERLQRSMKDEDASKRDKGDSPFYQGPLYDPRWDRQERLDRPRSWIFFGYTVGGIVAALATYLVLRYFF